MCFTLEKIPLVKLKDGSYKAPRPQTAKSSVECYKVVKIYQEYDPKFTKRFESNRLFTSLIQGFVYVPNHTYYTELDIAIHKRTRYSKKGVMTIDQGFHSYTSLKRARESQGLYGIVVKCIMPAGTKYYHDPVREEYVSTSIRVIERVK